MYKSIQTVRLTVAEGKKLIAKGIANNENVKKRLKSGVVIITRGSTNTYIAEALIGLDAPRGSFVTGKISPTTAGDFAIGLEPTAEIILVDGKCVEMSYGDALAMMSEGDIIFKGANLLNYSKGQVAVNVGAPDGGTIARLRQYTDRGIGRWIVPIGLEKDCSADLKFHFDILSKNSDSRNDTVLLNVGNCGNVCSGGDVGNVGKICCGDGGSIGSRGIYTEIEAIKEFADVDIYQIACGGINGAEGGVSLMICGSKIEVSKAVKTVTNIHGEPPFV